MVLFPRSGHRQKTCEKKASTLSRCATTNTCIHLYHHTLETQRALSSINFSTKLLQHILQSAAAAHRRQVSTWHFHHEENLSLLPSAISWLRMVWKEAAISSNTSNTSSIITFSQLILKGHPESRQRCGDNQCSDSPPYHSPNPCNKSRCVELTSF